MVDFAVHGGHELRPGGDVVLEGVPHVRPLPDALRLGPHARHRLLQRRHPRFQLGELVLAVLFHLICIFGKRYIDRIGFGEAFLQSSG